MTNKFSTLIVVFLLLSLNFSFLNVKAQPIEEIQKLLATDGSMDDYFGGSVSISGDYAIVGAYNDDDLGSNAGAAYIYYYNAGIWVLQTKLSASDANSSDNFGVSVSISGEYAIVGAWGDDDNGNYSGSAYIFYNNSGIWQQDAKLTAIDGTDNDWFGGSVSISGNYAIISAKGDDDNGEYSGSAYIFYSNSGTWQQQAKLTASDGDAGNFFGSSVSISGSYAIVGANQDDDNGEYSGSAYMFFNNSGIWQQQTKLIASDGSSIDSFGQSVCISGNCAIVGAWRDGDNGGDSGSAYVFYNNSGSWIEHSKLVASDGSAGDNFGLSVSIIEEFAIIGAQGDDDNGSSSGSAYIFYNNSGIWQQQTKLTASDGAIDDRFGVSVSIFGENAIVGAWLDDDSGTNSGSAYIFGSPLPKIWSGSLNTDWHNTSNWLDGSIPTEFDDVLIPAGIVNNPTLSLAGECNNITIESNENGMATLLGNGLLTIHGIANTERYFSGNDPDWHLVSSPMSNATANVFLGMYLQSFDESTYSYTDIINPTSSLNIMEGYGLYSTLGVTNKVTFTGNLNFGSQSASFTTGADASNWNLLGNPFPSSIDWEAVTIPAEMSNEVHYIDASTGNNLSYVQGIGGTGSQFIPPNQGFFISATESGTLTFDDNVRTHAGGDNFYKSKNPNLLILQAANEYFSDETWIHFNINADEEHDGIYDAYKRISLSNPEMPQIFSITPTNVFLSVNGLPETELLNIGFTSLESGEYTINAVKLMESSGIVLEDKLTNEFTDLLANSYIFNFTTDENPERFALHFTPMAIIDNLIDMADIYSYSKDIYVKVPQATKGIISIYNIAGQEIINTVIGEKLNKITLEITGLYIVKVQSDQNLISKKVFIK